MPPANYPYRGRRQCCECLGLLLESEGFRAASFGNLALIGIDQVPKLPDIGF